MSSSSSSSAHFLTDHGAIILSWRLVMVTSLLLGLNAHGIIFNLMNDFRALLKNCNWAERIAFISARSFGVGFLIASLIILEMPVNITSHCNSTTRFAITAFFSSHALHHLQLGLRSLSYHKYRWDLLVLQLTGCIVIAGMCFYATVETKSGLVFPSNGCVLLLDSSTLPDKPSLLILAVLSVCHQAFTSAAAIAKICRPKESEEDGLFKRISFAMLGNGIPHWCLRLFSVTLFFFLPVALLEGNPVSEMALLSSISWFLSDVCLVFFITLYQLLLMSAFFIHTALDVELSALILRSTFHAKVDRRSSFGILGTSIDKVETMPRETEDESCSRFKSCRETRFSWDMFSNRKQDAKSTILGSQFCSSKFSLPLADWNRSENTLVGKETLDGKEQMTLGSFRTSSSLENLVPPPRPRRSNTTRITESIRTMFSSTSRYASVIQFYQDSSTPSPSPKIQIHPLRNNVPPPGWI